MALRLTVPDIRAKVVNIAAIYVIPAHHEIFYFMQVGVVTGVATFAGR